MERASARGNDDWVCDCVEDLDDPLFSVLGWLQALLARRAAVRGSAAREGEGPFLFVTCVTTPCR